MAVFLKWRWAWVLLLQALMVCLAALLLLLLSFSLSAPDGGFMYDVTMWALVPLIGLASSVAAVRLGLHYMLAWVAPPVCQVLAQLALTGLLPASPGMPMLTLLLSAFGAAAGEELCRRSRGRRAKQKH